jgi:hypothetical protein
LLDVSNRLTVEKANVKKYEALSFTKRIGLPTFSQDAIMNSGIKGQAKIEHFRRGEDGHFAET